jgi:nucleoside-diphosphate-sugar epimerase
MMSPDGPSNSSSGELPIVAITGASGYLGSVLVAAFGSAGFSVRRLVRTPIPGSSDRSFELSSVRPSDALDGVDVLVHCAYDMTLNKRAEIWQTNVFGTTALLDTAVPSGVRRTIAVSSMSAYAGTRQLYGRAKLDMEMAALSRGMVVVRPGLVYGPGWGGMAGTLRRLTTLPVLPDFGPKAHQFTVREDDLAAAMVALALAEGSPIHPVGIAHPDPVPFTTLLTSFATTEGKARPRFLPTPPMVTYSALRAAELLSLKLPVRADSLLGLLRPAPNVPNLEVIDKLGVTLRPFTPGRVPLGSSATSHQG